VAGLTPSNIDRVAECIGAVVAANRDSRKKAQETQKNEK
jgi:hypothetical protein